MSSIEKGEYFAPQDWRRDATRCRECKARLFFLRRHTSTIPLDVSTGRTLEDGRVAMRSHFESCPRPARFTRKKKATAKSGAGQRRLF